jgi:hypothetical protein
MRLLHQFGRSVIRKLPFELYDEPAPSRISSGFAETEAVALMQSVM